MYRQELYRTRRADYRSEGGGWRGRTSGSSAFVPLVSCSSVLASAVFCSLGSFCGHRAYTHRRRSSLACVASTSAMHAQRPRLHTVFSLCADMLR